MYLDRIPWSRNIDWESPLWSGASDERADVAARSMGMSGWSSVAESDARRRERHRQRALFDGVAELYEASRRSYPTEIVDLVAATVGLQAGSRVLEVGCGTGQLSEELWRRQLTVMAIDIGPSMIATARRRLGEADVHFEVTSFEDLEAPEGSFDLVVSATAFHWVDPEVKFVKAAQLLRPGGWLALLATGERYEDPFGAALLDMWIARSDDGGAWVSQAKLAETEIADTVLFEPPIERLHEERMRLPVEVVVGVENTRAISLSWTDEARRVFTEEMRDHLRGLSEVDLVQETSLSMAQKRGHH